MNRKCRAVAVSLILPLFCGCAALPCASGRKDPGKEQSALEEKDRRIQELEQLLAAKEAEIGERDGRIRELKEKLRGFGVF